MSNAKCQAIFMAFFKDEKLPFVGICVRTWRPSYVLRGGERFLPMENIYVDESKGLCTANDHCLDAFCPLNKTPKNYIEAVLYPDEQKWFKENWLDIVDQCKVAFAEMCKKGAPDQSKFYMTVNLKTKNATASESVGEKQ